ncbi:hypothetical protein IEQ34_014732 [Dendrobium chrysotoxum]|uniref:Uncharacterized protein n=1 Tax=Dendrobium chrysotoxum TaxID=161865 RepID=A0AAV7G3Z8_DENCH|nr:hypothetical protein IEQ34_014732 [Dendrobium chrysotoxum]
MKDLPAPLHVREEDIMRILKVPDIEHLLFEVRQMSRYIEKEFLFKALEQQCIEDGFIRGFLKGVRLMQRKIGVQVEGVTPSQASDDFPSGSDGDEIESELQKVFDLDVDDETDDPLIEGYVCLPEHVQVEYLWLVMVLEEYEPPIALLAWARASGSGPVKVRALGGDLAKVKASGGGPAKVRASGGGAAELRRPLVVRRWCGRTPTVVRQNSDGGRRGV